VSTVAPPNPALVQLLAQAANAPTVQIVQPPPAITALPAGTIVEAVVLPRPDAPQPPSPAQAPNAPPVTAPPPTVTPNLTLQTGAGIITARAPLQLPAGTRVDLEVVRTANNQVATRLIAVNNVPVQGARPLPAQIAAPTVQNPALSAQIPPPSVQNPALKAQILPLGLAWTSSGPAQLTALGPISAFVILGASAQTGTAGAQPGVQSAQASAQAGALPGVQTGGQAGAQAPQTAPGPLGQPIAQPTLATPTFQLSTGSDLTVRLISVQVPGVQAPQTAPPTPATLPLPTPAPGPLGQPIAQPALATPTPAQTPGTPAPGPTAPPQPAPRLVLAGAGGLPPAAPAPPQTVQPAPVLTTLAGTVTALSPTGAPIVQIDTPQVQGQIQLNARANVPVGTAVTFEVTAQAPPQPGAATAAPNPVSALPLSGPAGAVTGWPILSESLTLLQRTDPQAAAQLAQSIPDGGPRTAVAVMAFAQALRTGDPRQWPGDANLRAIERIGPRGAHLASLLSGEVSELAARSRDAGSEWRSIPIPWNAEGRIDRIALITRREEPQDEDPEKKGGGKGTRFLINLDLSRLGSMQLDGMFRKDTRGFDLMVRTKETLPDYMRRDLTGMFASSNAAMGLKGGLTFQVVKKFPDPVADENPTAQDKSGLWA
jgi:hypothetical protein